MIDFKEMQEALIAGNAQRVKELTEQAVRDGVSPADILNKGLVPGMAVIGERFKNNEVYVPEVLIAARAMKAGMAIIKPLLVEANVEPIGRVVIGTVKGDLHDIGKNLVGMMLEGAGFEVIDAGVDVAPEKFVSVAKEKNARLIGPFCTPDHHNALDEGHHQQARVRGCERGVQGHDRWRAGHSEVRGRDRRRWICPGRQLCRGFGQELAWNRLDRPGAFGNGPMNRETSSVLGGSLRVM